MGNVYYEQDFISKLHSLSVTQQSIQTLAHWILFHHRKHQQCVQVWESELYKVSPDRKLLFIYLLNDILQTCRKKNPEFIVSFSSVLPKALGHTYKECNEEKKRELTRIVKIWRDRRVLSCFLLDSIDKSLEDVMASVTLPPPPVSANLPLQLHGNPVIRALDLVGSKELLVDLNLEKYSTLDKTILSEDNFDSIQTQGQLKEKAEDLELSVQVLEGLRSSIEEDISARNQLHECLTDTTELSEKRLSENNLKLQEIIETLSTIPALKEKLKNLNDQLPPDHAERPTKKLKTGNSPPLSPTMPPSTPPTPS